MAKFFSRLWAGLGGQHEPTPYHPDRGPNDDPLSSHLPPTPHDPDNHPMGIAPLGAVGRPPLPHGGFPPPNPTHNNQPTIGGSPPEHQPPSLSHAPPHEPDIPTARVIHPPGIHTPPPHDSDEHPLGVAPIGVPPQGGGMPIHDIHPPGSIMHPGSHQPTQIGQTISGNKIPKPGYPGEVTSIADETAKQNIAGAFNPSAPNFHEKAEASDQLNQHHNHETSGLTNPLSDKKDGLTGGRELPNDMIGLGTDPTQHGNKL